MPHLAVDKDGTERIFQHYPSRHLEYWSQYNYYQDNTNSVIDLPKNTIIKIIGKQLTWEDEPIEI
ncbi:fructan hydrolase [bacterium]|jgi:hypothetical protein|nr:fructan hydrolase [bacterium]